MYRISRLALAAGAALSLSQPALAGGIDYTLATEAFEQGLAERGPVSSAIGIGNCYAIHLVWSAHLVKMESRDGVPRDLQHARAGQNI